MPSPGLAVTPDQPSEPPHCEREDELGCRHGLALGAVCQREEPQNRFDSLLDGLCEAAVFLDRDHERRVIPQLGCGDHVGRLVDLAAEAEDHVARDVRVVNGSRERPLELLNAPSEPIWAPQPPLCGNPITPSTFG